MSPNLLPNPPLPVDRSTARLWADGWIAAWNALDVEAVLARFTDDCQFRSPKALTVTGCGTVTGKPALRAYWSAAVTGIGHLRFVLESAHWDAESNTLLIRYVAELGTQRLLAAEVLDFADDGRVRCGTALYGTPLG